MFNHLKTSPIHQLGYMLHIIMSHRPVFAAVRAAEEEKEKKKQTRARLQKTETPVQFVTKCTNPPMCQMCFCVVSHAHSPYSTSSSPPAHPKQSLN